jgi:hypothetical protein
LDKDSQFIFEKYLTEMPVSSLDVNIGPGVHNKPDAKLLSNPKARESIMQLGGKVPYTFKINVVGYGEDPPENLQPESDKITVTVTAGLGEPLTKWMIGHRIGHAVGNNNDEIFKQMYLDVIAVALTHDKSYKEFTEREGFADEIRKAIQVGDADTVMEFDDVTDIIDFRKMSGFRSARKTDIPNLGEYLHELIAEYLVKGNIVILQFADDSVVKAFNQKMTGYIEQMLQNSVGKVIYDTGY